MQYGAEASLEAVRKAYQRRFVSTPGIISTLDDQVACSLTITQVDLNLDHMGEHFKKLREDGVTPDDHPWMEASELWRHARELVCGFYYRWNPRPPQSWLIPRKRWYKFVRDAIKDSQRYDSEKQVKTACELWYTDQKHGLNPFVMEPVITTQEDGCLIERIESIDAYATWKAVENTFIPNQEPVWISDTVLRYASQWLTDNTGIAWVEHITVGERLAEMSGYRYYGEGGKSKDGRDIMDERMSAIASIRACGEGQNLQHFNKNLIVSCPTSGGVWEQMVSRTHRDGQEADEVTFEVIMGCKEAVVGFHNAMKDAKFIQDSIGASQKLLYADVLVNSLTEMSLRDGPLWK